MNLRVEMPPALAGSSEARLQQLYGYLFRMAEQLNVAMDGAGSGNVGASSVSETAAAGVGTESVKSDRDELRALIVHTAEILRGEMDKLGAALRGQYTAISDQWNTYQEEVESTMTAAAETVIEQHGFVDSVDALQRQAAEISRYHVRMQDSICQGFFERDSGGMPVLGVAVGQGLTGVETEGNGQKVTELDAAQTCAFFTGERVSFRIHGQEVAQLSNRRLYAAEAEVTGRVTLGDWLLENSNGLSVKYIG